MAGVTDARLVITFPATEHHRPVTGWYQIIYLVTDDMIINVQTT